MIPDNIDKVVLDKHTRLIIRPFMKNDGEIMTFSYLSTLPKIFQKDTNYDKITEVTYKNLRAVMTNKDRKFYRFKRQVISKKGDCLIERLHMDKITHDHFPILRNYHSIKEYERYSKMIKKGITFIVEKIDDKLFFHIDIDDMKSLSKNNIDKLTKFIDKNISKHKID